MNRYMQVVKQQGEKLFTSRQPLLSLWQELAEQFYPERADFTTVRNLGNDMAGHLLTSGPVLARRDLGNAFGGMLRPAAKEWFHLTTKDDEDPDLEAKVWLDKMVKGMRKAMYDRRSQFARATKEGDHDFATFGQCVLSVELNPQRDGILYRAWHLRDVVWVEGPDGAIEAIFRKWKPTANDIVRLFPATAHQKVRDKLAKDPFCEFNAMHIIMRKDVFEGFEGAPKVRQPWVSIHLDCTNDHEMELVGSPHQHYVVPRWQTVSGSQYAHSPSAIASLPDGRLIQDITRVLLEAGEKAVDPPMLAVRDAIRSDLAAYAGGVTWVDAEYDERLGEVLRPMTVDKSGISFGFEFIGDLRAQIADAWFLNKLNLPPTGGPNMTAYEVSQRVQEFIRNALPLFEPMEADYNGALCDVTFELLLASAPQLVQQMPRSLRGREVQFTFESPLHDAIEKAKVGQFMEAQQVIATAMQLDPSAAHLVDTRKATRKTLSAIIPAEWLRSEQDVEMILRAEQEAAAVQQQMAAAQQGAQTAKTIGEAAQTMGGPDGLEAML